MQSDEANGRQERPVEATVWPALFSHERLPPPDEDTGFFCHPDFAALIGDDEISQDEGCERLAAIGWEGVYVSGDDLLSDDTLDYDARGWQPDAPDGDGWMLVSVFDTEDGPYALFVRPNDGFSRGPR